MLIDWTTEFGNWLDRLEADKDSGNPHANLVHRLVTQQLGYLQTLTDKPAEETKMMRTVARSRRYPLWRVSHPYVEGVAVRLIVWFPDDESVVVAVLAADKAGMSDVFYDNLGVRADVAIDRWLYELDREEER
jgi:hypothetical protein